MKKFLLIPHHPDFQKIKIRLAELAHGLAVQNEVYLLDWHSSLGKNPYWGRLEASFRDLFRSPRLAPLERLHVMEIPMLHRPFSWVQDFNAFWLKKMIDRLGVDVVVNGSYYLFSLPKARPFKYVLDFADVPTSGRNDAFDAFITKSIRQETAKADCVTASSQGLAQYLRDIFGVMAYFIPNGADFEKFKSVAKKEVEDVRRKYRLENKWVIGFIGHFGDWVDIPFLIEVFKEIRQSVSSCALLIVGSSDTLEEYKRAFGGPDIVFTGSVDPRHIEPYFLACDIGVLPNKKSAFQDLAFHIKLIEFCAAEKFVVASDLEEIKNMGLPNVRVASLDKEEWVHALLEVKNSSWRKDWHQDAQAFDWKNIALNFENIIEKA